MFKWVLLFALVVLTVLVGVLHLDAQSSQSYVVVDTVTKRAYGVFASYDAANDWAGKRLAHPVIYRVEVPRD